MINENRDSSRALSKEIMKNETYASQRIVALYKLHQIGKFNLLASTDSLYDFFHRKIALEKILHQDEMVLDVLQKNQNALTLVRQKSGCAKREKKQPRKTIERPNPGNDKKTAKKNPAVEENSQQKNTDTGSD